MSLRLEDESADDEDQRGQHEKAQDDDEAEVVDGQHGRLHSMLKMLPFSRSQQVFLIAIRDVVNVLHHLECAKLVCRSLLHEYDPQR